jgi:hypothetical protein
MRGEKRWSRAGAVSNCLRPLVVLAAALAPVCPGRRTGGSSLGWVFSRVLAACLLVSVAGSVRAEPPAGDYEIAVAGDAEIWQPGGSSEFCESEEGITLCFVVDSSTDVAGAVAGVATFTFTGLIEGELVAPVSGQVGGSTEKSNVSLSGPLEGGLVVLDIPVDVDGSVSLKCKEDSLDPALFQCKPKLKLCLFLGSDKLGCDQIGGESGDVEVSAVGGPWVLRLALVTDVSGNVTGDAEVELATGQMLAFTASGKYKSASDSSKLDLQGVGQAASSRIKLSKLVLSGGNASSGRISLKIAGQKGKALIAP